MFSLRTVRLTFCAALALTVAAANARATEAKKITSVEGITEYRLDNGLRVLLFPDPSKPTVTVNVTYLVGSRLEGYGETGMAHLLEHMVFKGTPKYPGIWKSLQDHGATFNGSTSFDRTNYFETLSASDENLDFALDMESDRMVNSFIAKKDLDSEFSVVRNEFEMGENNPGRVLSERMMSTAYLWHNYGKSTIGSREDIERVPIDRLKAFYRKFYQPDNAYVIVAGKFDEAKTLEKIQAKFGSIPRPTRQIETSYTVEPTQDGEREVTLRRAGDVQEVGCIYHVCAGTHDDMPAVETLSSILEADQTGRLYKALVEPHLATRVNAEAETLCEPGVLEVSAEVRMDKSLDEVRKVMLGTLDNLAHETFTEEEVERAKNGFARQFDLLINDSGRVGVVLSEWAAQGDWRLMFLYRDRMAKVTAADVQRVAANYLKPSNRTVGMFIPTKSPERSKIPPVPDVVAMLKDYHGAEALAKGEAFDADPLAIEGRAKRTVLPNGLKLVLLSKKTRGHRVNASMTIHYGSEEQLKGHVEATSMLGQMLTRGTTKHTRRQIQDTFDKLKARVFVGGGGGRNRMRLPGMATPGALQVEIETKRKNLPEVLELVAELLKESTFPEKEFEKERKQMLSETEQQLSEPTALAFIEVRRNMVPVNADDVRYVPTPAELTERIKAVKLDEVKQLYKNMMGAGNAELAIVGDFDESEISSVVDNAFKSWTSPTKFERIAMPYRDPHPETREINTPDKANAFFAIGTNLEVRDDDPEYPALMMANYILGGNSNSRMLNRIRQKEGLSYGCGAQCQASSRDKSAIFFAFGICAPQNAAKALTCAREEIDGLLKKGVTEKELKEAVKGYIEQNKVMLSNDGMITGMLAKQAYDGRTMQFVQDQLKKVQELTVDQVNAAFRKYVKPEKFVVVRAGDFEKKEESPAKSDEVPAKKTTTD